MAKKQYTSDQLKAMYYLSLPTEVRWLRDEDGNKIKQLVTLQDIAEAIGIHRNTLLQWRKDVFDDQDLKNEMLKYTVKDMPEVLEAITKEAKTGKAKHAELFMKLHRMLREEKTVHNIHEDKTIDVEAMREKARRYTDDEEDIAH